MAKLDHYPKNYGSWAGRPDGVKPNYQCCAAEVSRSEGNWTRFSQCTRKCGHGPDGAFCKTHDPVAVERRRDKSTAAWKAKWNAERYQLHGETFFNALQKIADGYNDARGLAQEVIEEFHKGAMK